MNSTLISIARDAAILIVVSAFLAFSYNELSSKRLSWMRSNTRVMASDSLINALSQSSKDAEARQGEKIPPEQISPIKPAVSVEKVSEQGRTEMQQQLSQGKQMLQQQGEIKPQKTHSAPTEEAAGSVLEIRIEQVEKLLTNPDVLFIDARRSDEYEKGHIGNAINIFTPEFEHNIHRIIGLPREKPIVVYCGGGACELSHELAKHLAGLGFKRVFVYTGGWTEWQEKK